MLNPFGGQPNSVRDVFRTSIDPALSDRKEKNHVVPASGETTASVDGSA